MDLCSLCISMGILPFLLESYQHWILNDHIFCISLKKSAKHIFWTFKGIFRKRVAMLSKKGSHTETLWSEVKTAVPWVKTTTSRPLRIQETWKKVQTQFTSWIQNILYLWISASKTAVFGVKIQIDKKSRKNSYYRWFSNNMNLVVKKVEDVQVFLLFWCITVQSLKCKDKTL